jgi:hypothetical protein
MDPWQSVLLAFGGNAALLLVLGWLARSLGSQLLAKDLEKFKNDLATTSSNAAEQLKHELAVAALEHNVKFSKLYERRAEVVAEAYGLLVEAHWDSQSFVSLMEWVGEPPKQEKYVTAMNKSAEFYRYFDKNRIYLPQALCDQLDQFLRGMRSEVIGFGVYASKEDDRIQDTVLDQKYDAWSRAATYFDQEVPKAKAALETELRRIIGAS